MRRRTESVAIRLLVAIVAFATVASARAQEIIIAPSGDMTGQTDYEVLQAALLDAEPGTTIELEAGTFYLNHVMFVEGFVGTFKGAGKDLTFITTVGVLEAWPNDDDPVWLNPPSLENPWPAVLSFVDGRFTLSDMTFQITEENPTFYELFGQEFTVLGGIVYILGGEAEEAVRSSVRRVGFQGSEGTFGGYNVVQGLYHNGLVGDSPDADGNWQWGFPVTGRHLVSECSFETMYNGNSVYQLAEDASLRIKGNTFVDVSYGLSIFDTRGRIGFFRNEVSVHPSLFGGDGAGVFAVHGFYVLLDGYPVLAPVDLTVRNNVFYVDEGFAGIDAEDLQFAELDAPPSLRLTVQNNEIITDSAVYGVYGYGLDGPSVKVNDFQGSVLEAGLFLETTANAKCIQNRLQGLTAGTAGCLLWDDTYDNLFIGANAWADVLDMTDDPKTPEYDGLNRIISTGPVGHKSP